MMEILFRKMPSGKRLQAQAIWGNASKCKKKLFTMRASKLRTGWQEKWEHPLETTELDGPHIISSKVLLSTGAWGR